MTTGSSDCPYCVNGKCTKRCKKDKKRKKKDREEKEEGIGKRYTHDVGSIGGTKQDVELRRCLLLVLRSDRNHSQQLAKVVVEFNGVAVRLQDGIAAVVAELETGKAAVLDQHRLHELGRNR